eukprot:GILK01004075.1.p1 GENE.GILK01004075.1~~GILK01004075.1.p1  ORF type:complete len:492 (+),score=43.43 GILK01004075.1:38-1477(+)
MEGTHQPVSIGELNCEIVDFHGPDEQKLKRYLDDGGLWMPNVTVPNLGRYSPPQYAVSPKSEVKDVEKGLKHQIAQRVQEFWDRVREAEITYRAVSLGERVFNVFRLSLGVLVERYRSQSPVISSGCVRSICWHPFLLKLTICLQDNAIYVYDLSKSAWSPLILRHEDQMDVTAMAWKAFNGSCLAVAVRGGVCIWSRITGDSRSWDDASSWSVVCLKKPGHGPVSSLSWDPNGRYLVSASRSSSVVCVWDVAFNTTAAILRVWSGASDVHWSPCTNYLFITDMSDSILLYETRTWQREPWRMSTRCDSACWSTDGKLIIYSVHNDPTIYSLLLPHHAPRINANLLPVSFDLSVLPLPAIKTVRALTWDPTGERLAVLFSGSEEAESVIAIFVTNLSPQLDISFRGFLRGPRSGGPVRHIAFCPAFKRGALLAAAWDSGKVSFYPLIFTPESESRVASHSLAVALQQWQPPILVGGTPI